MTGFITSLSELAVLIFQSFRLPSLLPALAFAAANGLLVFPNIRETAVGQVYLSANESDQALILVLITALTAYSLNTLNMTIIRWFEGYPLIEMPFRPGSRLLKLHQNHYLDLRSRRGEIEKQMREIRRKKRTQNPTTPEYLQLQMELQSISAELTLFYPSKVDLIAPTRLGNVVASAEDHPYLLYKMDAVALWALLVPILTKEGYSKFIEQEKASLDFLLNSLIVVAAIGTEIILVGFHNSIAPELLALEAVAVIIACWVLYNLSIEGAMGWGQTIRASFDLYRHKLREELKIKYYNDFGTERSIWQQVSAFYRDKTIGFGKDVFDYAEDTQLPKEDEPKIQIALE